MPLQKIDVLVAATEHPDDPEHASTHRVIVLHRDRLEAERNATENGIPLDNTAPQAMTSLVLWAALKRLRVHSDHYQTFLPRILDTDDASGAPAVDDESDPELPDPTRPAPVTPSPSPSGSTGQASTGSTPSDPSPEPIPTA